MKRTICALLALTMIFLCVGCGANDEPSGIYYEITGIAPNETVMEVDGNAIPAELYFYWTTYNCNTIDYQILSSYNYYGVYGELLNEDGTLNWDAELSEGTTVGQFAREQAENSVKLYAAIENMAKEYGVEMTDEDKASLEENRAAAIEELGGEEEFQAYLEELGISEDSFNRLSSASYLVEGLTDLVLEEGSPLYLAPEDYNQYAIYADHILLSTQDTTTGEALSEEEIEAKRATAEDLLAQLQEAEDVEALFSQLADEYSEDPGRDSYPNGYIYAPGTMVTEFEDAAASLNPGEISGIVESTYGYHIILRKDLTQGLADDPDQKRTLAQNHLDSLLQLAMQEAEVTASDKLDTIEPGTLYVSYTTWLNEKAAAEDAENAGNTDGTTSDNSTGSNNTAGNDAADNTTGNDTTGNNTTGNDTTSNNSTGNNDAAASGENGQ